MPGNTESGERFGSTAPARTAAWPQVNRPRRTAAAGRRVRPPQWCRIGTSRRCRRGALGVWRVERGQRRRCCWRSESARSRHQPVALGCVCRGSSCKKKDDACSQQEETKQRTPPPSEDYDPRSGARGWQRTCSSSTEVGARRLAVAKWHLRGFRHDGLRLRQGRRVGGERSTSGGGERNTESGAQELSWRAACIGRR